MDIIAQLISEHSVFALAIFGVFSYWILKSVEKWHNRKFVLIGKNIEPKALYGRVCAVKFIDPEDADVDRIVYLTVKLDTDAAGIVAGRVKIEYVKEEP